MSLINVSNLTFAYDGSYDDIFQDASFQLDTSWKLGFTGRNGRGKTTFLNLLLGKYEYKGTISAAVEPVYFPFPVEDLSQTALSAAEAACPDLQLWQLERELSLLDVDPDDVLYRPFGTLSHGERTKLMLAALMLRDNAFLLIDEPTNHLDMAGRQKVSQYLNSKEEGYILVSHDRVFLDGCVDHILSINRQDIVVQKGNFSSWLENKRMQDEYELAENHRLKKDVRRLKDAARRTAQWSDKVESTKIGTHSYDRGAVGAQSARMMKRSKAIQHRQLDAAAEKEGLLKNLEKADALKLHPLTFHSRRLATLRDVEVAYGGKAAVSGVSFQVEQGDRIALRGKNGSGKTSLLKLINGEDVAFTGEVDMGRELIISYVPQSADGMHGSLSDFAVQNGIDETLFKAILRKLDFARVQFEKDMSSLSQGQKKKVLIARSLCQSAHLYIWDEPLNYIDVLSRMQIEELLAEFSPTLLFVEHDRAFCDAIATKIIEL